MSEVRKFPTFDAYQAVLQHPGTCFYQEELRHSTLETDLWGFPRVRSGGFALTYKVTTLNKNYALRCFYRNVQDRYIRYQAITAAIQHQSNPNLVSVRYAGKGIRVGKNWFPITLMPWVDGDTLEGYIHKNLKTPKLFEELASKFVQCIHRLQEIHFAHGDLSHQNILVRQGEIVLVDYDGMYVPSLSGRVGCEIGHSNFQHPGRSIQHFDAGMDRFSAIVIYLALKALSFHPDLWKKYEQSGDGLLFRNKDFMFPHESALLQEMETLNSLKKYVYFFRKICLSQYENVPSLDDFIKLNLPDLPRDEIYSHKISTVNRVIALDATKRFPLIHQIGKIVTVVGEVRDYFDGKTKDNQPHIFLNFGNWKMRCFTIVLWGDGYGYIKNLISESGSMKGKWISVTGLLTAYHQRPQIAIDTPYGIELLNNEDEARYKLGLQDEIQTNDLGKSIAPKIVYSDQLSAQQVPEILIEVKSEIHQPPKVDLSRVKQFDRLIQTRISELYTQIPSEKPVRKEK